MSTGSRQPVTVGIAQINNSFSGQSYLPLSAGCLQAYVLGRAPDAAAFRFLPPLFKRVPLSTIIGHLSSADIAGFSVYAWNERISLEAARRLKHENPATLIVFGGPQVPNHAEAFLRAHPFIDVVVHNEGEESFWQVLQRYPATDFSGVTGISYLTPQGQFVKAPPTPRIRALEEIPSPYLSGVFGPLMRAHEGETWIAMWETNRGCPFHCTFCDWGALASKIHKFDQARLEREVEWFSENKIEFVFCCDANFGILKRDIDIIRHVAEVKGRTGYPKALSLQNTKNATERAYQTQKVLADAGLNKGVTLSMQSLDPTTLANVRRDNISLETYEELQRRFTRDGIETYSDLILGLPGETYETFANGVGRLIASGQHNRIQFNNLSILVNSEMATSAYRTAHELSVVSSEIINIHGRREEPGDGVREVQDLVVATASMPSEDWRRTRAFSWMASLLHFDKLMQIPFVLAHEQLGIPYRTLIEAFLDADREAFPSLAEISSGFSTFARSVQDGGPEYVYSREWLGIYWPADEAAFIRLVAEDRLDSFFEEALRLLLVVAGDAADDRTTRMLRDAVNVNRAMLKRPNVTDDLQVAAGYDVVAFWRGVLLGKPAALIEAPTAYRIVRSREHWDDFTTWCQDVVWYGNKKGAYLYPVEAERAGT